MEDMRDFSCLVLSVLVTSTVVSLRRGGWIQDEAAKDLKPVSQLVSSTRLLLRSTKEQKGTHTSEILYSTCCDEQDSRRLGMR